MAPGFSNTGQPLRSRPFLKEWNEKIRLFIVMPPKHCTQEQSHSKCPHPAWREIRIDHHRQPDRQRLPVFHLPPIPKGTKPNQTEENAKDNIAGFKFKHDSFEGMQATSESPQHAKPFLPLIDPVHHSSILDLHSMFSKLFLVPTATISLACQLSRPESLPGRCGFENESNQCRR